MASITIYDNYKKNQHNGNDIDWDTDTVKVMLVTNSYTPAQTTHAFQDDITNEVTGTNYTADGETIGSITVTLDTGTVTIDGANVSWTTHASGFSNARYAIIYKDTGTPGTSPLFGYINFGADKGNTTGDLEIQWNASGIVTI